jgi:hypothetical protein
MVNPFAAFSTRKFAEPAIVDFRSADAFEANVHLDTRWRDG